MRKVWKGVVYLRNIVHPFSFLAHGETMCSNYCKNLVQYDPICHMQNGKLSQRQYAVPGSLSAKTMTIRSLLAVGFLVLSSA